MTYRVEEIAAVLRPHRDALARLGVRRLALFGSAVRGGAPPRDLDFLVEFEHKTFDAYMETRELLEALFQRPVDLVTADAIKPALYERILAEARDVA